MPDIPRGARPDISFLAQDAVAVAEQLIGWRLYRRESTGLVGGTIVETEAYMPQDAASHSYRGQTPRTKTMFGPSGHLYVYFTYGMHHCVNIVTGPAGQGQAVLIRALLPTAGVHVMQTRRQRTGNELTNGPAKVCQALAITLADDGAVLQTGDFLLLEPTEQLQTVASPRIGITKDVHRLWRFTAVTSSAS